jgi:hypothetical protein
MGNRLMSSAAGGGVWQGGAGGDGGGAMTSVGSVTGGSASSHVAAAAAIAVAEGAAAAARGLRQPWTSSSSSSVAGAPAGTFGAASSVVGAPAFDHAAAMRPGTSLGASRSTLRTRGRVQALQQTARVRLASAGLNERPAQEAAFGMLPKAEQSDGASVIAVGLGTRGGNERDAGGSHAGGSSGGHGLGSDTVVALSPRQAPPTPMLQVPLSFTGEPSSGAKGGAGTASDGRGLGGPRTLQGPLGHTAAGATMFAAASASSATAASGGQLVPSYSALPSPSASRPGTSPVFAGALRGWPTPDARSGSAWGSPGASRGHHVGFERPPLALGLSPSIASAGARQGAVVATDGQLLSASLRSYMAKRAHAC